MMENAKFEVEVATGYKDVEFSFDTLEEAISFSELALEHAKPYINSDGEVMNTTVSISMTTIELKKEDNDNELAV